MKGIKPHKELSLSACSTVLRSGFGCSTCKPDPRQHGAALQPVLPVLGAMRLSPLTACSAGATWQLTYIIPALLSSSSSVLKNNITLLKTKRSIYLKLLRLCQIERSLAFYLQIAPSLKIHCMLYCKERSQKSM